MNLARPYLSHLAWLVALCAIGVVGCVPVASAAETAEVAAGRKAARTPRAPRLLGPCDTSLDRDLGAGFSWDPVRKADYYLLCVARAGVGCPDAVVDEPDVVVTRKRSDASEHAARPATGDRSAALERFAGSTVHWSVAACRDGATPACRYQPSACRLTLPAPGRRAAPAAVSLVAPADLHVESFLTPQVRFRWKPGPQATGYRVCVVDDPQRRVDVCGTTDSYTSTVVTGAAHDLALPRDLAVPGKMLGWTVGACNRAGCTFQPQMRRLSVSSAPPVPTLLVPQDGRVLDGPRLTMRWEPLADVDSYRVCVAPPGVECDQPGASVYDVPASGQTRFTPASPLRPGQVAAWTVAACVAGRCSYAPSRTVSLPRLAAPALLGPPSPSSSATSRVRLEWAPVASAAYYRACAYDTQAAAVRGYDPEQACASLPHAVTRRSDETSTELVLDAGGSSADRFTWTVAACHPDQRPQCRYQRATRSVALEQRHTVLITLDSLEVHEACDDSSPGDWIVAMVPVAAGTRSAASSWPAAGSHNARTGEPLTPGHPVRLSGVAADAMVGAALTVVDCDGDGRSSFKVPIEASFTEQGSWEQLSATFDCGGEELREKAKDHDMVGTVVFAFTPEQWRGGGRFSSRSAGGDCGEGAFTAWVEVSASSTPQPQASKGTFEPLTRFEPLAEDVWR